MNGTQYNPEALAFVIMPFKTQFDDFYSDVIVPGLREAGYRVERAENVLEAAEALHSTIRHMQRATLVVADLTLPTAFVMYQLGLAQGMLKSIVLITRRADNLPPDLRTYEVLEYSTHYKKVDEFRRQLSAIAQAQQTSAEAYNNPVAVLAARKPAPTPSAAPKSPKKEPRHITRTAQMTPTPDPTPERLPVIKPLSEPKQHKNGTQEAAKAESTAPTRQTDQVEAVGSQPDAPSGDKASAKEMPHIYGLALESRQAMDRIGTCARRINELTTRFDRRSSDTIEQITALKAQGDAKADDLMMLLSTTSASLDDYAETVEGEIPTLHISWERLQKNTSDLIATARIETSEDREAATLFVRQLEMLQSNVAHTISSVQRLRETIGQTPSEDKQTKRAIASTNQTIEILIGELTRVQAYLVQFLGELGDRMGSADMPSPPGTN
ncbi:MAG: hypothetical protein GYB67_09975 [Chloroflexi bacterium]|nr:hypothetical protein [Chloroflexota bacterium]